MSRSSPGSPAEPDEAASLDALFRALEGRWRLRRRISNGARFSGKAVFAPLRDGSLELTETGQLQLPEGRPVEAFRKWQWLLTQGGELNIRYPQEAGGGEYHRVQLHFHADQRSQWRGEARHRCGDDIYRGFYSLRAGCLLICHHVTGPAKNYRMASLYLREGRRPWRLS